MDALRNATPLAVWREVFDHPESPRNVALELRSGTVESDYFMARSGLESDREGALTHGLAHLAELLAIDPSEPEWLDLLGTYRARLGTLEAGLPPPGGERPRFAIEAVRAYELADQGDVEAAVALLSRVVRAKSDTDYLDAWALPWIEVAPERLGAKTLLGALAAAFPTFPEHAELIARRTGFARRWAEIAIAQAERLRRDGENRPLAEMMTAGLCRKAGRFDEGLALADVRTRPAWSTWIARGLLLRRRGDTDGSVAAFDDANRLEPTKVAGHLEAGDTLFDAERWREARASYERALAMSPGSDWAPAAIAFCRWRESGDRAAFDALVRRGSARAVALERSLAPYVGYVPRPVDPDANVLRTTLAGAASPPDAAVARAIRALAATPFQRARRWADASRLASTLRSPDAASVLGCVVHPPGPPPDTLASEWIPRVQITAAFVLAHLSAHEPWAESARRTALLAMLGDRLDWTAQAAVIALAMLVRDAPAIATDVHAAIARCLDERAPHEIDATLALSEWSSMPGLLPDERAAIERRLTR